MPAFVALNSERVELANQVAEDDCAVARHFTVQSSCRISMHCTILQRFAFKVDTPRRNPDPRRCVSLASVARLQV
jgi:hypothetical protein